MRRDGYTNGATYEEIIDMSVKSKYVQYDSLVSDDYDGHKTEVQCTAFTGFNMTYLRKKVIGNLEENGYLEKHKVSRASYYKTKLGMVELV